MSKKILLTAASIVMAFALTGCGDAKFDASNQNTITTSLEKIKKDLKAEDQEKFKNAVGYYLFGGREGFANLFSKNIKNEDPTQNLRAIHGLTGPEIIKKYDSELALYNLIDDIAKLRKDKKFEEALTKCKELQAIKGGEAQAKQLVSEIQKDLDAQREKQEYIKFVKVEDFEACRIETWRDKNVPAVRFSIRNTGNRSLSLVKVTVYFANTNGNTIFEKSFHPVLADGYFSDNKEMLKPNYVREMGRNKYYTIDQPLNDWDTKNTKYVVSEIEFEKSSK